MKFWQKFRKSVRNGGLEVNSEDMTKGEKVTIVTGGVVAVAGGVTSAVANTVGDHAFLNMMVPGVNPTVGAASTMMTAYKVAFVGKIGMYAGFGLVAAGFGKGFVRGFSEQWKTLKNV